MGFNTAETYAQNEATFNEKIVIMKNLDKMVTAEANKNYYSHFVYFKAVFYWLMPHMEIDDRKVCELDWRRLVEAENFIKKSSDRSDASKSNAIEELRRNFIDTHQYYIYATLPRASIISINEEGDLNYNKTDFNVLTSVIRNGNGLKGSLEYEKNAIDKQNLKNSEIPPEQETEIETEGD